MGKYFIYLCDLSDAKWKKIINILSCCQKYPAHHGCILKIVSTLYKGDTHYI